MSNRELFHATMRRETGGSLLHMEQGFNVRYEEWKAQGLPDGVANPEMFGLSAAPDLFDHLNVAKIAFFGFDQFCQPGFPEETLAETPQIRRYRNHLGNTYEVRNDGGWSLPHELDFAVKTLADYMERRDRFRGNVEKRVDWAFLNDAGPRVCAQEDHVPCVWVHGPFAFLRELLGAQGAMMAPFEEPDLVRTILDDHLELAQACAAPVIEATRADFSFVWEDMCGSSGPLMSRNVFREFSLPWYRRWKRFLLDMGVPWIMMDTDGDPSALVDLWLEGGVDCIQPWEVNSSDALRVAREHPDLALMGGIYKHIFEPDHPSQAGRFKTNHVPTLIDEELERVVRPLRERGGYIAGLDHWVHPGVRYPDYVYYCERLAETYGKANRSLRFLGACE